MSIGRRPPAAAWDDERNAVLYDDFARRYPMYTDTSRDLVARLRLPDAATVVDLCCGTGVATDAVLEQVGDNGRVIALDQSAAMIAVARRRVIDRRVEWHVGPAETIDGVVRSGADAVICNSAMWQTDLGRTLPAVRAALRTGGRLAFNIGRGFVMLPFTPDETSPDRPPSLMDLMSAVAVLEFGIPPQGGLRRALHPTELTASLEGAGFSVQPMEIGLYDWPAEQQYAWLQIPVFNNQVPGRTAEERQQILDRAFSRLERANPPPARWAIFVADAS